MSRVVGEAGVEDLDEQGLDVVDAHRQQHPGVHLVDVAQVRQLHDDACEQRALVGEAQLDVALEDGRVALLDLGHLLLLGQTAPVGREQRHQDEDLQHHQVAVDRRHQRLDEPRVRHEQLRRLRAPRLQQLGADFVRGSGIRGSGGLGSGGVGSSGAGAGQTAEGAEGPGFGVGVEVDGRPQHHDVDDGTLEQDDLVLLAQCFERVDVLRELDDSPHEPLGHVHELRGVGGQDLEGGRGRAQERADLVGPQQLLDDPLLLHLEPVDGRAHQLLALRPGGGLRAPLARAVRPARPLVEEFVFQAE